LLKNFIKIKKEKGFITAKAGMNSFVWNMRYPMHAVDGTNVMWAGSGVGAKVVPGSYIVRLIEKLLQKHQLKSNLIPVTTSMLI
jgi:hypothetical protein